jgi:hypothetical protein
MARSSLARDELRNQHRSKTPWIGRRLWQLVRVSRHPSLMKEMLSGTDPGTDRLTERLGAPKIARQRLRASYQGDQIEQISACCPQAEDLLQQLECWITCACREFVHDVLRRIVFRAESVAQRS